MLLHRRRCICVAVYIVDYIYWWENGGAHMCCIYVVVGMIS